MKKRSCIHAALLLGAILIAGCGKPQEEITEAPRFDAKVIAAEADKGNLVPLQELNDACSAEVEKSGKRASACDAQDEVGALRKPLKLNF